MSWTTHFVKGWYRPTDEQFRKIGVAIQGMNEKSNEKGNLQGVQLSETKQSTMSSEESNSLLSTNDKSSDLNDASGSTENKSANDRSLEVTAPRHKGPPPPQPPPAPSNAMEAAVHERVVAEFRKYSIIEITVNSTCRPTQGEKTRLGVTLKTSEWPSPELRTIFPGYTSYTFIADVRKGSLADIAGLAKKDVLCWRQSEDSDSLVLLTDKEFTKHILRLQENIDFVMYVARKNTARAGRPPKFENAVADVAKSLDPVSDGHDRSLSSFIHQLASNRNIVANAQRYFTVGPVEQQLLWREIQANAKLLFESDRDRILDTLPGGVVTMFNQIGFIKHSHHPVLVLNPFCIPPGEGRDAWYAMYKSVSTVFGFDSTKRDNSPCTYLLSMTDRPRRRIHSRTLTTLPCCMVNKTHSSDSFLYHKTICQHMPRGSIGLWTRFQPG
jgi:hypothetical protein